MGTSEINGPLWGAQARRWADLQEATARPLYEHALARVGLATGTPYLDAGCGAGMALSLAAVTGAALHGVDASESLLAIARTRVPGATLKLADLEALPFADATFDVVTGFNAFQYAGQPARALAEAHRVLRPGGRLVVATWSPADTTQAASLIAALKPLLPPPPPGAPGPFALSDEAALRSLASGAGFDAGEIFDVECPFAYADVETAVHALGSSGVARRAGQHAGEDAVDRAHREALRPFVRSDGSVWVQNRFRYLLASCR